VFNNIEEYVFYQVNDLYLFVILLSQTTNY